MGAHEGMMSRRPLRIYKRWRYPGIPIPHRLRSVYRLVP